MTDEPPDDRPLIPVPDHTEEELRAFVEGVLNNRVFLLQYIPPDPDMARSVFLILTLSMNYFEPQSIGTIYEYYDKASPLSVSQWHDGERYTLPSFLSCRFMNRTDWQRAKTILDTEAKRRDDALKAAFSPSKKGDDEPKA